MTGFKAVELFGLTLLVYIPVAILVGWVMPRQYADLATGINCLWMVISYALVAKVRTP